MRRRDFIKVIAGSAAAWPLVARAQQRQAIPVVGFLSSGSIDGYRSLVISFRKGLAELGYIDGQNVSIEYGWAEGHFDRLPELATGLIQHGAVVIVATGISSALEARKASATIPLVFLAGDDPVKFGLVESFNRPGGNSTGVAWLTSELLIKRLGILRELVPDVHTVGVLINPRSPENGPQLQEVEIAGRTLGQPLDLIKASTDTDFEMAFSTLSAHGTRALIVSTDPFFFGRRDRIIDLAARYRIPTMYDRHEYATDGGLISYGTSYAAANRELGIYAAKILQGTKASDLPVEQATKFEMIVNLKTAKSLALEIPPKILALADDVIE